MSETEQPASPSPIVRGEPAEVSGGVFVIPDERVPLVPNVGIVVGEDAVLVIDTGMGVRSAEHVLAHAEAPRRRQAALPHGHALPPRARFRRAGLRGPGDDHLQRVAARRAAPQGRRLHRDVQGIFGSNVAAELEGVELVDPHVVYDGEAEIDLGGHVALLRSFGRAHTGGDQVVLVDGSVLFGGDLFETRMFPIVPYFPPDDVDVDGDRWIEVLDELGALNPSIVVPGHGEVTDATLIRDVREYLAHVRGEAARLRAAGASADDATAEIERALPDRWSAWDNPEWIGFAARHFYDAAEPA